IRDFHVTGVQTCAFRSKDATHPLYNSETPHTMWLFHRCFGGHSGRETPGPIPNPEAKPASADGTAPARVRESRTPPNNNVIRAGGTTFEVVPPAPFLCCFLLRSHGLLVTPRWPGRVHLALPARSRYCQASLDRTALRQGPAAHVSGA